MNAALKTIKSMRELFKGGKRWIKDSEKEIDDNGNETFCLIGALHEVNGGQIAQMALAMSIDPESAVRDADIFQGFSLNDEVVEETITSYNDDNKRIYKDISHLLKKTERLIEKKQVSITI